ncbi:MAG: hypothetical protein JNM18_02825 [Planctomycetaceae bacterium]|nr:hypothetical protein [Planctomycetaceae bacterium]
MTTLTWIANTAVSWLDTAEALVAGGEIVDTALADALTNETRQLRIVLDEHGIDTAPFFNHAVPLAYHESGDRALATVALRKTLGSDAHSSAIGDVAMALTEFKHAGNRAHPKLLDDLTLRSRPIREQWEGRGPGLLAGVAQRTESTVLVDDARIFVVHPIRGGGGVAHPWENSVRIEAVLTNPIGELPEIVRLAWLLAGLNVDLPRYSERLNSPLRLIVARLALVPVVLGAAADVELVRPSAELLPLALRTWGFAAESSDRFAPIVERWWQTYQEMKLPWPGALAALEQMLTG